MGQTSRGLESPGAIEPRGLAQEELQSILRCPSCHADRSVDLSAAGGPTCRVCGHTFATVRGVPILLREDQAITVADDGHVSHDLPEDAKALLRSAPGLTLNIGGGATREVVQGCVEVEFSLFVHTTVVADVHELPFVDDTFSAVVSMNAFEHFSHPERAARELYRILRPGGEIYIHTAFLQPVHEAPHHYYNATEYGVREWFEGFDIDDVSVSANFAPNYMLAWLVCEILHWVRRDLGDDAHDLLSSTRLGDWEQFWQAVCADPSALPGEAWECLRRLPNSTQAKFAAGFEVRGRKPSTQPRSQAEQWSR